MCVRVGLWWVRVGSGSPSKGGGPGAESVGEQECPDGVVGRPEEVPLRTFGDEVPEGFSVRRDRDSPFLGGVGEGGEIKQNH